jgi:hypothetical protein
MRKTKPRRSPRAPHAIARLASPPPHAMSESELREMIEEEVNKRISTNTATEMPGGVKLESAIYPGSSNLPASEMTARPFEPSDIEAALRRQPAQECPSRLTVEQTDKIFAANDIPPLPQSTPEESVRFSDSMREMVDGDLGITKAWAHDQKPVYVREVYYRDLRPKAPSPALWLADFGYALKWGSIFVVAALMLAGAFDIGETLSSAPAPAGITLNFRL